MELSGLKYYSEIDVFSKQDYYELLRKHGYRKKYSSFLVSFQQLINEKAVQRIGRNLYQITANERSVYYYQYSLLSERIAKYIEQKHSGSNYVIFEKNQINEFVVNKDEKNIFFVFTDKDSVEPVFNSLKKEFPGKVLVSPSVTSFKRYCDEDSIIILRLISESPKGTKAFWHESLEKMLVDIISDHLLKEVFCNYNYKEIYENVLKKYIIDESKMFRYARRRGSAERLRDFTTKYSNSNL